ncbi:hypothetical protein GCM10027360_27340 [Amycolatopsis echigonensis]
MKGSLKESDSLKEPFTDHPRAQHTKRAGATPLSHPPDSRDQRGDGDTLTPKLNGAKRGGSDASTPKLGRSEARRQ